VQVVVGLGQVARSSDVRLVAALGGERAQQLRPGR
jgi:hypothetical protein